MKYNEGRLGIIGYLTVTFAGLTTRHTICHTPVNPIGYFYTLKHQSASKNSLICFSTKNDSACIYMIEVMSTKLSQVFD